MLEDPNQTPRASQAGAHSPLAPPPVAFTRRERTSRSERFALAITSAVGTLRFFGIIFAWTTVWLVWNALAPRVLRFDPYPAFVLWLFLSNMIQLFLMPLIMIGQNLQARAADKRAEADLAIDRTAADEIKQIRSELTELKALLTTVASESR